MPKKLLASARFSRQSAFGACFYRAERAAETRVKTVFAAKIPAVDGSTEHFWSRLAFLDPLYYGA